MILFERIFCAVDLLYISAIATFITYAITYSVCYKKARKQITEIKAEELMEAVNTALNEQKS